MSRRSGIDLLQPSPRDALGILLGWLGWVLAALAVFGFMFGALFLASELTPTPGPVLPAVAVVVVVLVLVAAVLIVAGTERAERAERARRLQTTKQEIGGRAMTKYERCHIADGCGGDEACVALCPADDEIGRRK